MELPTACFEGLQLVSVETIFSHLESAGFNAVRIPLSYDGFMRDRPTTPQCVSNFANPELQGLSYRGLLEKVIKHAASQNVLVLLDLHRLNSSEWPTDGMWYSSAVSERNVLNFWELAAQAFGDRRKYWNVMGADIFNEPHGATAWGPWKSFVEESAARIFRYAPHWTILAQGVGNDVGSLEFPAFWAENLAPAVSDPPRLRDEPRKLVLSPHVYGKWERCDWYSVEATKIAFAVANDDVTTQHLPSLASECVEIGERFASQDHRSLTSHTFRCPHSHLICLLFGRSILDMQGKSTRRQLPLECVGKNKALLCRIVALSISAVAYVLRAFEIRCLHPR